MFKDESPKSVYEVGCGSSGFLQELKEKYGKLRVGGMDINPQAVEVSKELFPEYARNFSVIDGQTKNWPIKDKSWDISFTIGVLLLIPNPYQTIREMLRVSRKIILAEFQSDEETGIGDYGDLPQPENFSAVRIHRDYLKIFESLGVKATIEEGLGGKSVIRSSGEKL